MKRFERSPALTSMCCVYSPAGTIPELQSSPLMVSPTLLTNQRLIVMCQVVSIKWSICTVPAARLSVKPVRNKVIWCEMATYIHRMRFSPCRRKPNKVLGSAITSNSSALAQLLFDGQSRHNSMFEARLSNCSITGSAWGFFSMR